MLYNCALNPLGAILEVPYGALGSTGWTRAIMEDVFDEVFVVLCAAGYSTNWQTASDYAQVFYERLLPPTRDHESSMLQDLKAGRPTEIESLSLAVVALAEANGLDAPVNRTLGRVIRAREEGSMR
jgi:2-dehydropantoate 2-reductase